MAAITESKQKSRVDDSYLSQNLSSHKVAETKTKFIISITKSTTTSSRHVFHCKRISLTKTSFQNFLCREKYIHMISDHDALCAF